MNWLKRLFKKGSEEIQPVYQNLNMNPPKCNALFDVFEPDKPLFVIKLGVEGLSHQKAQERARDFMNQFVSNNANIWVFAHSENRDADIKCIWGGKYNNFDDKELSERLEKAINSDLNIKDLDKYNLTEDEKAKFSLIIRNVKLERVLQDEVE